MGELEDAVAEAIDALTTATGKGPRALFDNRHLDEPGVLSSAEAQRAAGIIEGAAVALGVTVNERFDELRVAEEDLED